MSECLCYDDVFNFLLSVLRFKIKNSSAFMILTTEKKMLRTFSLKIVAGVVGDGSESFVGSGCLDGSLRSHP